MRPWRFYVESRFGMSILVHMRPSYSFDLIVVGAGGGPDETNLSAFVLRSPPLFRALTSHQLSSQATRYQLGRRHSCSRSWQGLFLLPMPPPNIHSYQGSGQGTLARLLRSHPNIFQTTNTKNGTINKVHSASDIYSFVRYIYRSTASSCHISCVPKQKQKNNSLDAFCSPMPTWIISIAWSYLQGHCEVLESASLD